MNWIAQLLRYLTDIIRIHDVTWLQQWIGLLNYWDNELIAVIAKKHSTIATMNWIAQLLRFHDLHNWRID